MFLKGGVNGLCIWYCLNGNPLQYSCLENPMDGGAWCATVHGVAKSQTRLSDFTHRGQVSLSLPYSQFKIITLKFPSFYILGNTYSNFWSSIVETFNKGAPAPGKLDMWRQ